MTPLVKKLYDEILPLCQFEPGVAERLERILAENTTQFTPEGIEGALTTAIFTAFPNSRLVKTDPDYEDVHLTDKGRVLCNFLIYNLTGMAAREGS